MKSSKLLVLVLVLVLMMSMVSFKPVESPVCSQVPIGYQSTDAIVLVAYQVWHGMESHECAFLPFKKPYDSRDRNVISRHIQEAKERWIDGFVVDWYGPKDDVTGKPGDERGFQDLATERLFEEAESQDFLVALMYDDQTVKYAVPDDCESYVTRVKSDLEHARDNYFTSPAYLKINGRPALFIFPDDYVKECLYNKWGEIKEHLGVPVTLLDRDPNPQDEPDYDANFDGFYAWVTPTGGIWDPNGREWGEGYLEWFYMVMQGVYADKEAVGGVWPGFDDSLAFWSENRYMARYQPEGMTHDLTLKLAVDNNAEYILVGTWNDFEEGTDIEFGVRMLVDMEKPDPEVLIRSSPVKVAWSPDIGSADLEIWTTQDFINYEFIGKQTFSCGKYLSLTPGNLYELKLWANDPPYSKWVKIRRIDPVPDENPVVFETETITVTSPSSGESWQVDSSQTITWTSPVSVGNVKIQYSIDNGCSWSDITSSTENDGSFPWTVPDMVSNKCLIRVSETDGVPSGTSAMFSIVPGITVTSPNGGEELEIGTNHAITWTSTGTVGDVKIEYSTNHGDTWTEIIASTINDGSHPWTVPNTVSNQCLVRVSEVDGSPWDISNGFFKIFQPAISVTSPDGGEVWVVGTQKNITWDNIGTVGAVKIEYSTDNGYQWIEIVASAENEGLYSWTIPDTVSNLCLVRVSEIGGTPFDESNNVFSIVSTPSITVISPNGGETLYVGSIKNITWTSTGTEGNVKIRCSTNNGDQWTELIASTENDGSYPWTIPGVASNQCLVEVSETDGSPLDTSDNVFSIEYTPTITVTSPNGGENLDVDSNHTITWNTKGNVGNVMIQYSVNGGTLWDTIAQSTENDGSFNWTVPDKPSDNCLVRISAGDPESGLSDTSNDVFSIVSPSLGSITVTSPNGGEKWFVGSTHEIKWTAEGIDKVPYVTIEYSINRGNTWFTIVSSVANASNGVFNWTVPNTPSDKCIVRVRGVDEDNAPSDTSDRQFSIRSLPSPSIVVTAPNGGETWMMGDQRTISWETTGSVGYVAIDYSTDSGDNWTEIIQSTENDGSYDWTVADTASDYCLVRVNDADSGGQPSDTSDAVFSIVPHPSITVTSPNGGEQWQAGSSQIITWNSTGIVGNLLIEYSIDGGENWIEISAPEPNDGSYNWLVPDPPSDDCLVRISTTDTDPGDGISDVSDAVFSITETQVPSLTVTYPNGGELLFANATYEIKWTSIGTVDNVAIHYSTNGGETWSEIIQSTENDGSHDWTVPETESDNCLLRVMETDGNPVDISDAVFSIVGPTTAAIKVTTPNGGETWLKGSSQEIKWTSTGTINSVSIDCSLDNGTTWAAITASTPNDGSFEWTVPETPSDDCLVRIIGKDGDWDEVPSDTSNDVFSIITSIPGAVRVVFPNGGETWEAGSMQEIAWNSSGNFDRVNIEYSPNSGGTWLTIIESYDDTGTYDWEVPDTPSDYCLVRIVAFFSESDNEVSDISDDLFAIVPPTGPTITVETPNGGELLYIGYLYDITWTSIGEVGEVTIEYSSNGGDSWEEIIASTENDGYFEWTVPDDPSESGLVRISETDGFPLDVSNAVFGIGSPPSATVEVQAPNGGETLDAGSEYQIAWDSTGLENVSIEYSTNNGVSWSFVTYAPAAEGVYTWIVPGTDSDNCLVRVSGSDSDGDPSDMSDAVFSIVQPVQASVEVLTPNGGESLGVGGEYHITWISTGVQEVLIEYSYNNGESWEVIDTADAANSRYTWTVPNTPSEICRVRISGNDGGQNPTDVSGAVFSIIADSP